MTGYRLATLDTPGGQKAAALVGDMAYEVALITGQELYSSVQAILDDWPRAHEILHEATKVPLAGGRPLAEVSLLAPLPRPHVIYAAGANYHDHADEMTKVTGVPASDPRADGGQPWFFLKSPHCVVGPAAQITVTQYGRCIDWEGELVAIIGRKTRDVSAEDALDYVAGYTCGNDISARDQGFRLTLPAGSPFRSDWTRHKSFDGACPLGPWIVPAPYLPNADNLPIRLWVNEQLKQDSNTRNMIFSTAEQIASLSRGITLHPGDVVMTGTPAGVGASRQEFLSAGDRVLLEIGEIGELSNLVA